MRGAPAVERRGRGGTVAGRFQLFDADFRPQFARDFDHSARRIGVIPAQVGLLANHQQPFAGRQLRAVLQEIQRAGPACAEGRFTLR